MNLLSILAQSTQSSGGDHSQVTWFQIATVILMPIILLGIAYIVSRLKRGDDKFDTLAVSNAKVSTEVKGLNEGNKELARAIEKLVGTLNEERVVNAGGMGELKTHIARYYVTKEECRRCHDEVAERFREVHTKLHQIEQGK